jgi:hypothetical protein
MLHKRRVISALYYSTRRRLRTALGIPRRAQPPLPLEQLLERHGLIARFLQQHLPPQLDPTGKVACEVGAGDCLASASLFLAKGASHVDIVEVDPPVISEQQLQVLHLLKKQGLPMDLTMIQGRDTGLRLDEKRVTYHRCYMENFNSENAHDFIFSFSVIEHIEDLGGFYASCWKTLRPGGWMLHLVDLSGHGPLDDPVPPLDFQTYPDWLYNLIFPPYHRATRRFFNEHVSAVTDTGFIVEQATPTRKADAAYVDRSWPKLRSAAKARSREEFQILEFLLLARKP